MQRLVTKISILIIITNIRSRFHSIEECLNQWVAWAFIFKSAVNRNTEKLSQEIRSVKTDSRLF